MSLERRRRPINERFWAKVNKDGPVPDFGQHLGRCWIWSGGKLDGGYGSFGLEAGKTLRAHRVSYQLVVGPIPAGLELDHLCRVPACVNPSHLEPVTRAENARRGWAAHPYPLKTHCENGHEFTPENTSFKAYRTPDGSTKRRVCRACHRETQRRYRKRRTGRLLDVSGE